MVSFRDPRSTFAIFRMTALCSDLLRSCQNAGMAQLYYKQCNQAKEISFFEAKQRKPCIDLELAISI